MVNNGEPPPDAAHVADAQANQEVQLEQEQDSLYVFGRCNGSIPLEERPEWQAEDEPIGHAVQID